MQIGPPAQKNFTIFVTQDGSPTLDWPKADGSAEKMHHSGGALGESLYIYHRALELTLSEGWPVRLLSLGLGLAYNELIAIAELHKRGATDWKIWSFESEDLLRESFTGWLNGEPSALQEIHDQILQLVCEKFKLNAHSFKKILAKAVQNNDFELRRSFPQDSAEVTKCTCVFYDAFSKKMDPDLWVEESLTERLHKFTAEQCVLATYAATGALNRSLQSLGFRLLPRGGFLGKRESTLAIRGEIR